MAKEFDDPYTTNTLYVALVRPILEFCSCVWSPQYREPQATLEFVQNQFLIFALRNFCWDAGRLPLSYRCRLKLIDLPSLQYSRTSNVIIIVHKLFFGSHRL